MGEKHPIEGLMTTAMNSIKEMVDVNTIVGDAVQTPDGSVIIPISKVTFGFASGGGEYGSYLDEDSGENSEAEDERSTCDGKFPFAGGSGAGVSINPVAFMVVGNDQIKLLPVNINSTVDKILDLVPDIMDKLSEICRRKMIIKKNEQAESDE